MQWRRTLNAGLTRATGSRLVAAERRPAKPGNRAKRREYDDEALRTMRSVEPRTMKSSEQGARQAVDEFLAHTGAPLLLLPMASGRIAVKP